jgi:hypothetical protein
VSENIKEREENYSARDFSDKYDIGVIILTWGGQKVDFYRDIICGWPLIQISIK